MMSDDEYEDESDYDDGTAFFTGLLNAHLILAAMLALGWLFVRAVWG